ncbi:MAG TPA: VWA domain-containing protein [Steroidobacteraceae bacterium]|nr:VWA domain-containing protein [Steroidobacteraceae bacterium]
MKFGHPLWLATGTLACLCLLWLWYRYDIRQHAALARFVSPHLRTELTQSVSVGRRRLQRGFTLAALALLFVALAGPLVGYRWELVSRRGIEIIFAVDTSRSMSTPDVKPDRLTRAKLAIDDFTNELDGDAIGLVAFAGDAFLVCPMTLDYGAFHESLSAIDINTIPRGGTNIASAIRGAQIALRRRPGSDKILILVTDGEDLEGDALTAAQAAARQDSLKIYTIGVGTAQGDLIPLSDNPNGGFVKDDSGDFVKSRLDEPALKAIAAATGGQYAPLGPQGQGFETLYQSSLAPLLKHDLASRQQRVYIERYQWPLSGALALLLLSLLIGSRRRIRARSRRAAPERRNWAGPAAASLLLPLTLSPWSGPARASPSSAQQAYDKGDFAAATREYAAAAQRDPKTPVLQFNAGAAAYRAGQFPQAAQAFQASISRAVSGDSKRLAEQQDAYYNLGNTLYRTGQGTLQSSQQQTLQSWEQAVKAYDTALELRADDADAKYNRDLVKRKIDELKKNPPQNPQNKPNNQPNNQQQQGPQQNPPQNSQQPPKDGKPPPGQQPPGQPPPGKQPPGQQPPGQQPPGQQPPGQQPPGQQPPGQQPPGQQPPGQQPPGQQPPGQPPPGNAGGDADQDDSQHAPGQMSREEARQLLDSQKGEERHALGVPLARKEPNAPPDKPVRDW